MSRRSKKNHLDEATHTQVATAIGKIPSGLFVLTARYEDRATGILASWVQQVAFSPPMISVAIAKGRPIMPVISESHRFGLCQLPKNEKVILRKFASGVDPNEDPFLGFEMLGETVTDVPIFAHSMSYLECEVKCHVDVEADHDLFIGTVLGGQFLQGEPWIHLREDGFRY